MTMDTSGTFRFYEIKVSKSDFYSKSDHTFLGHFNYYVMPDELYEIVKQDVPKHIGVHNGTQCIKKPIKQSLQADPSDLKGYMIRSLCRDVKKLVNAENPTLVAMLTKELQDERRMKNYNQKLLDAKCEELYLIKNPQEYEDGTRIFVEPMYEWDKKCGIGTIQGYSSWGYAVIFDNGQEDLFVKKDNIKEIGR